MPLSRDIPPRTNPKCPQPLTQPGAELQELYDLPQGDLDLLMAETAEIRSDPENQPHTVLVHCRLCAGTGPNHRLATAHEQTVCDRSLPAQPVPADQKRELPGSIDSDLPASINKRLWAKKFEIGFQYF